MVLRDCKAFIKALNRQRRSVMFKKDVQFFGYMLGLAGWLITLYVFINAYKNSQKQTMVKINTKGEATPELLIFSCCFFIVLVGLGLFIKEYLLKGGKSG